MAEKRKIRIALDAMGGDFAPLNEIQGALLAYNLKKDATTKPMSRKNENDCSVIKS